MVTPFHSPSLISDVGIPYTVYLSIYLTLVGNLYTIQVYTLYRPDKYYHLQECIAFCNVYKVPPPPVVYGIMWDIAPYDAAGDSGNIYKVALNN